MLGQVHEHIVRELGESSRTDTIFVLDCERGAVDYSVY